MSANLLYSCGRAPQRRLLLELPYFGLARGIGRRVRTDALGLFPSSSLDCGCRSHVKTPCSCQSEWEDGCVEGLHGASNARELNSGWFDPLASPLRRANLTAASTGPETVPPPSAPDSDGVPDGGIGYDDDFTGDSSGRTGGVYETAAGLTWWVPSWHSNIEGMPCSKVTTPAVPPTRSSVDWPTNFCFDAEAAASGDRSYYKTETWPETICCPGDVAPVSAPSVEEQLANAEKAFALFHYDDNASLPEAIDRKGATTPDSSGLDDAKLLVGAGLWFLLENLDLAQQAFCMASQWSPEVHAGLTKSLRAYLSPRSFNNEHTRWQLTERIPLVLTLSGVPRDGNTNATGWAWTRRETTPGDPQWVTQPWWPGFEAHQQLGVILPVSSDAWKSAVSAYINPPGWLSSLTWQQRMVRQALWAARIILHELMHVFGDSDKPWEGTVSAYGGYWGLKSRSEDAWNRSGSHHETSYDPDHEDDPKFGYEHPCWDECRMTGTMFQYWCEHRYSFLRANGGGIDESIFAHSTRSMG